MNINVPTREKEIRKRYERKGDKKKGGRKGDKRKCYCGEGGESGELIFAFFFSLRNVDKISPTKGFCDKEGGLDAKETRV